MTDIDASAFANPAPRLSPDTCRRAALTVCRSALGAGGTAEEVRDALEQLGLLDELREEAL
jgi:hypothetical protein